MQPGRWAAEHKPMPPLGLMHMQSTTVVPGLKTNMSILRISVLRRREVSASCGAPCYFTVGGALCCGIKCVFNLGSLLNLGVLNQGSTDVGTTGTPQTHPAMVRPDARALLSGNQAMSVWMGGV